MGIGLRYYLFEEDGTLRHVAQRIVEGLAHGKDRLPQYAGQSLRSIEVVWKSRRDREALGRHLALR